MKKISVFALAIFAALCAWAGSYEVKSPDGTLSAKISDGESLAFSVFKDGSLLLENCEIAMSTNRAVFGKNARASEAVKSSKNEVLDAKFFIKSKVENNYNEILLRFKKYSVVFRAYDDAVCYRFITSFGKSETMVVNSETLTLPFGADADAVAHPCGGWRTPFESEYSFRKISNLNAHSYSLPFVADAGAWKIAVLESDLRDYPALRLRLKKDRAAMEAVFAPYPKTIVEESRLEIVKEGEDFIAKTSAGRAFPWRILQVVKNPCELVESDAVYRLARPSKVADTSWIVAGTCQWDWWHGWTLEGVDFDCTINDETIAYYIDFAGKYGMKYMLVDEGWIKGDASRDDTLILKGDYRLDLKTLAARAKRQGVKLGVWIQTRTVKKAPDEVFSKLAGLGISLTKLDFVDRDDQIAIENFERVAAAAAKYKIAIDYHGCPPPAGLNVTYPNVLNFEGVRGNENNKGYGKIGPAHQINLTMTRNVAGPMDFTPGGMDNVHEKSHAPAGNQPRVLGSRAHQMAMYVAYFEPLKMLADSPTTYARYPEATRFMAEVPTVWDETRALGGDYNDYILLARRKGSTWYFAGMTAAKGREFEIDLSQFLTKGGSYEAEIFMDTRNTHKLPRDCKREVKPVSPSEKLKIKASAGGGFVMKVSKSK